MGNVNIYELKAAVNDVMSESEAIVNYALKQSIDLNYLGSLDSDDLKVMTSAKHIFDSFKTFITVEADAITEMYERQEKINKKLDTINDKLDKLNRLSKHE